MNALILNGSPYGHSQLDKAAILLKKELERLRWETHFFQLRGLKIAACRGCFKCWMETPGLCRQKDDAHILVENLAKSNLLILLTPVTFGGYGSLLKTALERTILPVLLPFMVTRDGETHHPMRYGHGVSTFVVGQLSQKGEKEKEIFRNIVAANARNLDSPKQLSAFIYDDMTDVEIQERMSLLASQAEVAA